MQPGREAYLVVGHRRREALVAPGVRYLAGKPGVARLRNGDHVEAVLAKQHHSFSSMRRRLGDPPMHYMDKPQLVIPEGSLLEAKLGSRLEAI